MEMSETARVLTILKDVWDQSMNIAKLNNMEGEKAVRFTEQRMTEFLNACHKIAKEGAK